MIDKTTFGVFPAAVRLIELLNQTDDDVARQTCKLITRYKYLCSFLSNIKDKTVQRNYLFLLYKEYTEKISELETTNEIKQFAQNTLTAVFRKQLRELD